MASIGLAQPYVAKYNANNGTPTYTGLKKIGKAIQTDINTDSGEPEILYADNGPAEIFSQFTGGNVVVGIDELSLEDAALLFGIEAGEDGSVVWDDNQIAPELGYGVIVKKVIGGVLKWRMVLLYRIKFRIPSESFVTQGDTITWGTPSLTADIMRDDSATHKWQKWNNYGTEGEALAALKTALGGEA